MQMVVIFNAKKVHTADVVERKNWFKILGGGDTNSGY